MVSPVKSPIRFSSSPPKTPVGKKDEDVPAFDPEGFAALLKTLQANAAKHSKPSNIKDGPSTKVPTLDLDDDAFNKFMADLDAGNKVRDKWLDEGDKFIAGSSSKAPPPIQHDPIEVPKQFQEVVDPYHALQAAKEGKVNLSEGMTGNLQALIGRAGENINDVAAEQRHQSSRRHSEDARSRHSDAPA